MQLILPASANLNRAPQSPAPAKSREPAMAGPKARTAAAVTGGEK